MALQVDIWMWWWIGEHIAGFGGMRNGIPVGFGGGTGTVSYTHLTLPTKA